MQIADPLRLQPEKDRIAFAIAHTSVGDRPLHTVLHFADECFVLTEGVGGTPHATLAASLAGETALWGYQHIRQRPYYWRDKLRLVHRIFRSTNLTLWQKRREPAFAAGLATSLLVCIVAPTNIFVGNVGDTEALLYRDGLIDTLTVADRDEQGRLTRWLGMQRLGLLPHAHMEKFLSHDIVVLATPGMLDFVSEDELRTVFEAIGRSEMTLEQAAMDLIHTATDQGSKKDQTVCLIKKIA